MELNTVIQPHAGRYRWRIMLCCEVLGEGHERTKHDAKAAAGHAARSVTFTRGTVVIASPYPGISHRPRPKSS